MNEIHFKSRVSKEQFVRFQFRSSFVRKRMGIFNKIILILITLLLIKSSIDLSLSGINWIYLSISLLMIFVFSMIIFRFLFRALFIFIYKKNSLLSEEVSYVLNQEFIQFLHKRGEYRLEWEKVKAVISYKEDIYILFGGFGMAQGFIFSKQNLDKEEMTDFTTLVNNRLPKKKLRYFVKRR